MSGRFSCFHESREEERAWNLRVGARASSQERTPMKERILRIITLAGAVVATALAGGASLKSF